MWPSTLITITYCTSCPRSLWPMSGTWQFSMLCPMMIQIAVGWLSSPWRYTNHFHRGFSRATKALIRAICEVQYSLRLLSRLNSEGEQPGGAEKGEGQICKHLSLSRKQISQWAWQVGHRAVQRSGVNHVRCWVLQNASDNWLLARFPKWVMDSFEKLLLSLCCNSEPLPGHRSSTAQSTCLQVPCLTYLISPTARMPWKCSQWEAR